MRRTHAFARLMMALAIGLMILPVSPTLASANVRSGARGPDKVAESNLRNGIAAALTFYTDGHTFTGLDAATAAAIESGLTWADGDALAENVVNIGKVNTTGKRVMLETLSASGTSFCVAWAADLGPRRHWAQGMDAAGGTFGSFLGCKNAPSGSWG